MFEGSDPNNNEEESENKSTNGDSGSVLDSLAGKYLKDETTDSPPEKSPATKVEEKKKTSGVKIASIDDDTTTRRRRKKSEDEDEGGLCLYENDLLLLMIDPQEGRETISSNKLFLFFLFHMKMIYHILDVDNHSMLLSSLKVIQLYFLFGFSLFPHQLISSLPHF